MAFFLVILATAFALPAGSLELLGRQSHDLRGATASSLGTSVSNLRKIALGTFQESQKNVEFSRESESDSESERDALFGDNTTSNNSSSNNSASNDSYVEETDPVARTLHSIQAAQGVLLSRLQRIDELVNSSLDRIELDLRSANATKEAVEHLEEDSDYAKTSVQETLSLINNTNETLNDTQFLISNITAEEDAVNKSVIEGNETLFEVQGLGDFDDQVKENTRLLNNVKPRLEAVDASLNTVEIRLQQGNISEVVRDISKRAMSDVFRDMGRALRNTI
mmetsp:Transcript_54668/g.116813  ORF Transcript_54668/g.116813 Transcript_54668/m.116813 type:complete len:280 (+) Transcript_54668:222-1061(+)|eukprot:CAMPEP_0206466690 /NCGR_PEP_ID=MMETSP0324_2-20121206/28604_1 /ASSEMBLY_ACC=CAM_ASM_000836 /TAXON_ID=2866 /ORGANISM="Crypthecodinium cohnii, Strain Seligo" /LENGTH=279 /DNA_ID=CAMNT_0053939845 /DNA_START=161 /DNA_END=1000 /DNA_ORIENTATION=+